MRDLTCDWFEAEDVDLNPGTLAFATPPRARAERSPMNPCTTCLFPPEDRQSVIAHLDRGNPD